MTRSVLLLLCLTLTGCSGEPPTHPISGIVRLDGEPLAYGNIRFLAEDGSTSPGAGIQPDGSYALEGRAGPYRIVVDAKPPAPKQPVNINFEGGVAPSKARGAGPRSPQIYADAGTTPLVYEIAGTGPATYDIDLQSKP